MTIETSLTTEIGQVRLELGDDNTAQGVLPDGSNLSDDQVQLYLTREGSVMRAVAGICEMLATRWAAVADLQVGPRRESYSQIAKQYAARADQLRDRYGTGELGSLMDGFVAVPVERVDGYTTTASEYSA